MERIPINPINNVNDLSNLGIAVGREDIDGVTIGFIYDHFGLIGQPKTIHPLTEWIANMDGWAGSSCAGINDLGQITGYLKDSIDGTEIRAGFVLDLDVFSTEPAPNWEYLPTPAGSIWSYGQKINNQGDILAVFRDTNDVFRHYLFNPWSYDPTDPITDFAVLTDPETGIPLAVRGSGDLNGSGQVCGATTADQVFRLTPGVTLEISPLSGPTVAINDDGVLAGKAYIEVPSGKGKKTKTLRVACRYTDQIEPLADVDSYSWDINSASDVVGTMNDTCHAFLHHADVGQTNGHGLLNLDDLVVGSADDMVFWQQAQTKSARRMTDRDSTGFSQIVVFARLTTTTGKGRK